MDDVQAAKAPIQKAMVPWTVPLAKDLRTRAIRS